MTPRPPYYFLDFWVLVIIGSAVFAFVRSRRRRRLPRPQADAADGTAREEHAQADGGASGAAPVQRPAQSRLPHDPHKSW